MTEFPNTKNGDRSLRDRARYIAPIVAIAIVSVTVSLAAWRLMVESDDHAFVEGFSGRANNQAIVLRKGIESYWDNFYAARALFEATNQPVTREQFETFTKSVLVRYPAILNMSWIPRVGRDDRHAHELAAARDGFPDYHVRDAVSDGSLRISAERDEYFPKFYSTEARTSPVYGLDLKTVSAATLDRIRDGNVLSISPPVMLFIGEGDRHGFWAGLPVYARGLPHDTVEDRRRNLLGIIQGVFQFQVMFDAAFSGVSSPVRVYIFASDERANDLPVYFKSRLGAGPIEARSRAALTAGMYRSFPIKFGDVEWTLVVTPEQTGFMSSGDPRSRTVLLFGLLLSAGLTSFVWASRRAARKLERQNLRFDAALNNMAQGLLMYDSGGRLVVSNRRFAETFGVPWDKWKTASLGTTVRESMQLEESLSNVSQDNLRIESELGNLLEQRKSGTMVFQRSNGRTLSALYVPMADGGFVVTFEDITEARQKEELIAHLAHFDALTDLPNRASFYRETEKVLTGRRRDGSIAVLSLDLDHFKSVNDTLGHPIGDRLLQEAARRMLGCIRETDIVARLGGDEFAVVQTAIAQPADTTALATRLIDAVSAPYQLEGHQVIVGTSVGIAVAPGDGTDPDQLMKNADLALYRCKADRGGTYRFFEPQMDARMRERRAIELDLRNALTNHEFTLDYQPLVNLKTGKVSTFEALIRWHHPERGLVAPLEFIPIAEETGLIVPIGKWALERACADAAEWPGQVTVAVNVSPIQFKDGKFFHTVANALRESHLPASRLELEITELVLMQDGDAALAMLHQIRDLGVAIAMDDFGIGYSSLGYLRSFPFDKIKIDQSFIRDLSKKADGLAILRAVVGLGRSLGIVTTAEGVETNKQLEIVRSEGCTEAQGYFFSQPRPASEVKELIASLNGQIRAIA
jgi:diguanylate cyclase (GGDEF)-like protein